MPSIKDQILLASQQLQACSDSARLDAELLLLFVLNKPRSYLFAYPEAKLGTTQQAHFQELIALRKQGHPIAHLTGTRAFWTLNLKVTSDTLIPRPETESLIETTLALFPNHDQALNILDLGTGTGAIALSLASEYPHAQIVACDVSSAALAVAQENAQNHDLKNVQFLQSNWFSALASPNCFDLIISNPPYIPEQDEHLKQGDVRFEPLSALTSGKDGLDDIRIIATQTPNYLKPQGWLMLEHGYDQGKQVPMLLENKGFKNIQLKQDLMGNDRLTIAQYGV